MNESITEHEILALIEDELAPAEAERIQRILRQQPELLAAIERLREDRALLRGVPEPELPGDLIRDMEPVLARPMLVDARPGSYRRRHQRGRTQRTIRRLAAAAAVLLVLTGAVAAVISTVRSLNPGGATEGANGMVATDDTPRRPVIGATDGMPSAPMDDDAAGPEWPPDGGTIHHHAPRRLAMEAVESRRLDRPDGDQPDAPLVATAGSPEPLPFALYIRTDGDAELAVSTVVEGLGYRAALVRNFSFEEARELERRWLAGRSDRRTAPPLVAGVDGGRGGALPTGDGLNELARRMRVEIRRALADASAAGASDRPADASKQLVGRPALAPTLERQLQLSGRGATHTVTLPRSRLQDLLSQVHGEPGIQTRLSMIDENGSAATGAPSAAWTDDLPRIRQALRDLGSDDGLVLLPVVVEGGRD